MPETVIIYRPFTHPHFLRVPASGCDPRLFEGERIQVAVSGLGQVTGGKPQDPDAKEGDVGLWDVDWKKLKAAPDDRYNLALLGQIQGALLGMDQETIDNIIRIFLQTYGVLPLYRQLMGLWPYDAKAVEASKDHLMERNFGVYIYWQELEHKYGETRDDLVKMLASGAEIKEEDFLKQARAAGWTQKEIDDALAEGKKLYKIVPKAVGPGQALGLLLGLVLAFFVLRSIS